MSTLRNPLELPDDLPVPVNDGASDHLRGMRVPSIPLMSTDGTLVDLAILEGRTIVYCYPRTGKPGEPLPTGWDDIPGARGCTPESCGFRDHHEKVLGRGVERIFGVSTQNTEYQQEVAARLALPFALLSDENLSLTRALRLPTFEVDGMVLLKRLTLVIRDGRIEHAFYPVFPPDRHAEQVADWLANESRVLGG